MKICPNCGKENRDKSFCTSCGYDITNVKPAGKVNITVTNKATGQPVSNADITIRNEDVSLEGTTDIDGGCIIKNVSFGNVTISAKADGYMKYGDSITIVEDDVFIDIAIKEKKSNPKLKSNLKIIGILIIIIAILCAGLYFVMNQNNTQSISNVSSSYGNAVDEHIASNVNSNDVKFKTVDFNGLFRADLPVECNYSEWPHNTNQNANYSWYNSDNTDYDHIYYFEGYDNLNDIINRFSDFDFDITTEGNLVIFENNGEHHYAVGVQSNEKEFVVFTANHIDELDNLKRTANSIVFE